MQIYSFFITVLIFAGSLGYGALLLRNDAVGLTLFRLGLGLWLTAHLVYLAGLLHLLKPPLVWAVILAGVFFLMLHFGKLRDQARVSLLQEKQQPGNWLQKGGWALLAGLVFLACIGAMSPPSQRDSLVYHLALPKLFLLAGGWQDMPQNIFSYFPGFIESLYTIALGLGSQFPAVIHFGFGLACLAATYVLGQILGLQKKFLFICLIALAATPTFWSEMTWAYVDLANAFFWLLTVIAFLRWTEEKKTLWLILLGFSMGAAFGCKYTSLLLFMIVPLGMLFELRKGGNASPAAALKALAIPLAVGLLAASPWWLKNLFTTGNPLFPFFWHLFPTHAAEWDPDRTSLYNILLSRYGGVDKGFLDYLFAPVKVFVQARIDDPDLYDGRLGWYYLLALPVLLFWRSLPGKIRYLLGLAVIYIGYWTVTSQQARFLLVLLPMASLLAGYFLQRIWGKFSLQGKTGGSALVVKGVRAAAAGIILLAIGMNIGATIQVFRQGEYWDYFTGRTSRDAYLQNRLNYYPIYKYINNELPEDANIFMVMTGNQGFYLERDFFSDSVFEEHTFKRMIYESGSAAELQKSLAGRGWTHLLIRPDYFFADEELSNDRAKEKMLNDLLNNYLRIEVIRGQYWLFAIPRS